jgi:RNA-directed DNA polymerase
MLESLRRGGPEGGKWYSLHDKVFAEKTLRAAYARVARNRGAPGVDGMTVEGFGERLDEEIARLRRAWQTGTYRPQAIRRTWIPKPGTDERRPLGIPTVRDRVVQAALVSVLEPIFDTTFSEHSHGFRPGHRAQDALAAVLSHVKAGKVFIVDADLKGYFDSIPHGRLLAEVRRKVTDGRVLDLIGAFLTAGIMEQGALTEPDAGTPQGGVISPLLANLYLDGLDQMMAAAGVAMERYADDFVICCGTPAEAERALAMVKDWTAQAGLTLHPTKTRIVDLGIPGNHIDFLGYRLQRHTDGTGTDRILRLVRPKSLTRIRDALRALTPRNSGDSLEAMITRLNRTLTGWFAYFRSVSRLIHATLDKLVRRRLRAMLCKRIGQKLSSWGRGWHQKEWSKAFFAEHGLFSLEAAHVQYIQPHRRVP